MTETLTITNFSGRLTRIANGDLNSGFAKFAPSFGYDPFSKPMNLTWLETPTSIAGITGLAETGKVLTATSGSGLAGNVHIIDDGGSGGGTGKSRWYQITPSTRSNSNLDSIIGLTSIVGTINNTKGISMEFFGSIVAADLGSNSLGKLYIGLDDYIVRIDPNGANQSVVGDGRYFYGSASTSSVVGSAVYRPLKQFAGSLIFGNGNTIGKINNTGTVVSSVLNTGVGNIYSELNPALGTAAKVLDMEVSPSNDYITLATGNLNQEESHFITGPETAPSFGSQEGKLYMWNGTDLAVTAATSLPSYLLTAIKTYFKNTAFFSSDTFGTTFNTGTDKILSLPGNKPPSPNAVAVNGNFITWTCPDLVSGVRYLSLYYFGSLDQENPPGLYRVLRWKTTQSGGSVMFAPLNLIVTNDYSTVDQNNGNIVQIAYGKHYLSVRSVKTGNVTQDNFLSFLITSSGTGTPQLGVYETQTQLFSKRIGVSQIRVYIEPSAASNGFKLDMIGSDGTVIANGTYTYTHGDLTDPLSNSNAVERVNFNTNPRTQYALGIRLTNTGTTNMTFKKIEIDYTSEGK